MTTPRLALATAAATAVIVASAGVAVAADARKTAPLPEQRSAAALPEGLSAASAVGANTFRISGADRYATAAEVSRATWDPQTAPVVYLASGETFPDALSVGPSTLGAGPLLLTRRAELPEATRAELERLRPCVVVVVGGEKAVGDDVARSADSYTDPTACFLH
ncbi:cell wall-binding repeat-containing protein [Quadrisphaera sp. DSM 44207]|uniref:cell wall-binding repeat-containing protein n=1 Tax=Quadrisphaera sp. DSM 44207 TaxID=1881057 RepID=UPI000891DBB2|nr:cell wall-binding repeat-containing protein [Quadrisphaera sp. DSM 44207]SDQ10333.1 Putative cell wall binding repeat 2 [Quadrisphaera sp. DSM 44207]